MNYTFRFKKIDRINDLFKIKNYLFVEKLFVFNYYSFMLMDLLKKIKYFMAGNFNSEPKPRSKNMHLSPVWIIADMALIIEAWLVSIEQRRDNTRDSYIATTGILIFVPLFLISKFSDIAIPSNSTYTIIEFHLFSLGDINNLFSSIILIS